MNNHTNTTDRPITGRITVKITRINASTLAWEITRAQRPGHQFLVGTEPEDDERNTYEFSRIRPGIEINDKAEVVFRPSGNFQPLEPGEDYVMLVSTAPGDTSGNFIVLGVTTLEEFEGAFQKWKTHQETAGMGPHKRVSIQSRGTPPRPAPAITQVDTTSRFKVVFRDKTDVRGSVTEICIFAMHQHGRNWEQMLKAANWFKKEGVRFSNTPSTRPTFILPNQMAIDIGETRMREALDGATT